MREIKIPGCTLYTVFPKDITQEAMEEEMNRRGFSSKRVTSIRRNNEGILVVKQILSTKTHKVEFV